MNYFIENENNINLQKTNQDNNNNPIYLRYNHPLYGDTKIFFSRLSNDMIEYIIFPFDSPNNTSKHIVQIKKL